MPQGTEKAAFFHRKKAVLG